MSWIFVKQNAVPWTPSDLTSLHAWYDAADATTVVQSGGLISQWQDKSGGGYHVSASGDARPTYTSGGLNGQPVVTFSGAQSLTAANASDWTFLHDETGSTVVAVWKAGNTSNPDAFYPLLATRSGGASTVGVIHRFDDRQSSNFNNTFAQQIVTLVSGNAFTFINNVATNNAHPAAIPTVVASWVDPTQADVAQRGNIYINGGVPIANNTANASAVSNPPQHAMMLGGSQAAWFLDGYIAEIVVCNDAIETSDIRLIEGYLAHKWGLGGNLPAGHPYKSAAPTV